MKKNLIPLTITLVSILCLPLIGFAQIPGQVSLPTLEIFEPEYDFDDEPLEREKTTVFKICGGDSYSTEFCGNVGQRGFIARYTRDCESAFIAVNLFADNLDEYPESSSGNHEYVWPIEEELYIKITEGEFEKNIGPITRFKKPGSVSNSNDVLFYSRIRVQTPSLLELEYKEEEGLIFNIELGVYTKINGELQPYPMGLYSNINEVFECKTFSANFANDADCNEISNEDVIHEFPFEVCVDKSLCRNTKEVQDEFFANTNSKTNFMVTPSPNPFVDNINIDIEAPIDGTVMIELRDLSGKIVQEKNISVYEGFNTISINSDANPGIYLLNIFGDSSPQSFKLIKI